MAAETGVDAFNSVWHPYRNQTTLLLLTNAWELLAKAILVQQKESITRGQRGETISAEAAIHRLQVKKILDQSHAETIQQIISLRHAACHNVLPAQDAVRHRLRDAAVDRSHEALRNRPADRGVLEAVAASCFSRMQAK